MGAPRKYLDELRERATRMALETLADPDRSRGALVWVAEQLVVHCEVLRTWVRKAQAEGQDVSSVSWQLSKNLYTELALDSLNMAIWQRIHAGDDLSGLIHHSDRGVRYRALRYTERLEEQDLVASVGSCGDSHDNALAEAFNSLFEVDLIRNRHKGPWRDIDDLEIAVAEYIDWFNHRRLHGEIDYVPPAEYEAQQAAVEPPPQTIDDLVDAR